MDAASVKQLARDLGADLVGIAAADTLNAFPPDPKYPQTPARISPGVKSVIVIVSRIPTGAFRCKAAVPVQYIDMLVLRRMDRIAYRLAEALERQGHPSFVTAAQETDWSYKRASYGRLSTRHLGIEAGLGAFGLEVNILTPEFGPRVYLTGVLTELALEADRPMTEQVCIGEACSRCLYSCPSDAVRHFGIDKRACASAAQEFGFATIVRFWEHFAGADGAAKRRLIKDRELFGSGRGCCGWWARSATVRAASPCARWATTTTPISPNCRRKSRRRRRKKSPRRSVSATRARRARRWPGSTTGTSAGSGRTAITASSPASCANSGRASRRSPSAGPESRTAADQRDRPWWRPTARRWMARP